MDGVGEWATTSLALGHGKHLEIVREIHFPHSLGLLYSAFTYYTGFKVNSGEYKVMGLAPYGEPRTSRPIRDHLIDLKDDGSFRLNLDYFDYCTGLTMTNERFDELFGGPPRKPEARLTQRDMDLAASIQAVTEEVVLKLARSLATRDRREASLPRRRRGAQLRGQRQARAQPCFEQIWMQPAAGDAGGALGAALVAAHMAQGQARADGARRTACGAPISARPTRKPTSSAADRCGGGIRPRRRRDADRACAAALAEGKALGWYQGRMEFGPRALGARSILGDPRSPDDAEAAQPEGQVPRVLPPVRAVGAARGRRATGSSSTATAPTCCWWPTCWTATGSP